MSAEWKLPCWNVVGAHGGPATCVLTWCCPCITYGINVSNLGKEAKEVQCAGEFTPSCCAYCLLASAGCHCIMHIPERKYLRSKYGIKEPSHGLLQDVLMTWCCSCCVLIQEYNEIATQAGAESGSIFTDLQKAKDAATADIKKQTAAAKEGISKAMEKQEEKDGKHEEKAEKEIEKPNTEVDGNLRSGEKEGEKEEKKETEAKEESPAA